MWFARGVQEQTTTLLVGSHVKEAKSRRMSELARSPETKSPVLVVEDEQDICALLADMLEAEGLAPHCVTSDQEAFEALRREQPYGCMIVDVNLGVGATGYDVARFARTIDPALPVIFVSGQTTEESLKANGVPGALFVPKPFTAPELMDQIHRLMGDNDD